MSEVDRLAPILVAGATGYVGGRLVPLLLGHGYRVRAFTRSMQKVRMRSWGTHENLEIHQGDMHDLESARSALAGVEVVYYLVHSMEEGHKDFSDADRRAAYTLVRAQKGSGVRRIIYLSGLFPDDPHISAHLRSRNEVAEILSLSDASLTTLRAAQLVGAGSASFEMIRWLVDRLPVMITPQWTHVRTQPISITDTLGYLAGVLEHPETAGESYDIGGPDILSYAELFQVYAEEAGLRKRLLIPFPWLSLGLSARWIGLVSPIPGALSRPLIEGMRNEVVCLDNRIRDIIPIELTPIRVAIARALGHTRRHSVQSSWRDAGLPAVPEWVVRGDAMYAASAVYSDAYSITLSASPEEVWQAIKHAGGGVGWCVAHPLWRLRGLLDRIVEAFGGLWAKQSSGQGARQYHIGGTLRMWQEREEEKRLLFLPEMRLPGEGLVSLCVNPFDASSNLSASGTVVRLELYFLPRGMPGRLYWHVVTPFHGLLFPGMLRFIAARAGGRILRGPDRVWLS